MHNEQPTDDSFTVSGSSIPNDPNSSNMYCLSNNIKEVLNFTVEKVTSPVSSFKETSVCVMYTGIESKCTSFMGHK